MFKRLFGGDKSHDERSSEAKKSGLRPPPVRSCVPLPPIAPPIKRAPSRRASLNVTDVAARLARIFSECQDASKLEHEFRQAGHDAAVTGARAFDEAERATLRAGGSVYFMAAFADGALDEERLEVLSIAILRDVLLEYLRPALRKQPPDGYPLMARVARRVAERFLQRLQKGPDTEIARNASRAWEADVRAYLETLKTDDARGPTI